MTVGLNTQNAFNTVGCVCGVGPYEISAISSMDSGFVRVLHLCDGDWGESVTTLVTRGVPQNSVLGPFLWNVSYDTVLRLLCRKE